MDIVVIVAGKVMQDQRHAAQEMHFLRSHPGTKCLAHDGLIYCIADLVLTRVAVSG